jgi:hypothetical protein
MAGPIDVDEFIIALDGTHGYLRLLAGCRALNSSAPAVGRV